MNRIGAIVALIVAVAGFALVYCPAAWSAAIAILVSTLVFAAAWLVILDRLRDELRGGRSVGGPRAAEP